MAFSKKESAISFLKHSKTRSPEAIRWIHPQKYKCHIGTSGIGMLGFAEKMLRQQKQGYEIHPFKTLQDGNYVAAFSTHQETLPVIYIDILRFYGDKIIEHWENHIKLGDSAIVIEILSDSDNESISGKGQNKKRAQELIHEGLVLKNVNMFKTAINTDHFSYINLNSDLGILHVNQFPLIARSLKKKSYHSVLNVIAEGSLALACSEGSTNEVPCILIDIFKFHKKELIQLVHLNSESK